MEYNIWTGTGRWKWKQSIQLPGLQCHIQMSNVAENALLFVSIYSMAAATEIKLEITGPSELWREKNQR